MGLNESYVGRTRPVLGFVDIGFALRGYRMLNDCPLNPGNSTLPIAEPRDSTISNREGSVWFRMNALPTAAVGVTEGQ